MSNLGSAYDGVPQRAMFPKGTGLRPYLGVGEQKTSIERADFKSAGTPVGVPLPMAKAGRAYRVEYDNATFGGGVEPVYQHGLGVRAGRRVVPALGAVDEGAVRFGRGLDVGAVARPFQYKEVGGRDWTELVLGK